MRLLLDSCVSPKIRPELEAAGHEIDWVGGWPGDPGDEQVLAAALKEQSILVTLDKDFGELAVAFGRPHCGILRLVNLSLARHASVCLAALNQYGEELRQGAIVTAEPGRLRVRSAVSDVLNDQRE